MHHPYYLCQKIGFDCNPQQFDWQPVSHKPVGDERVTEQSWKYEFLWLSQLVGHERDWEWDTTHTHLNRDVHLFLMFFLVVGRILFEDDLPRS